MLHRVRVASGLLDAFDRCHSECAFDIAHFANTSLCGLFLRPDPPCPVVMRLSSARDLWLRTDGQYALGKFVDGKLYCHLERRLIRRATYAYAPSVFVADHFRARHGLEVHVIRPPAYLEEQPADDLPDGLPGRYLIHYGQLRHRKGTDVLAEALIRAWRQVPELRMVWAGKEGDAGLIERCRSLWGSAADRVVWLGPLAKPNPLRGRSRGGSVRTSFSRRQLAEHGH